MNQSAESFGWNWRRHLWWQLILLAFIGVLAYNVSNSFDEEMSKLMPETVSNCSTRNVQASGYKAFFEVAEKAGLNCQRYEKSYRDLDKEHGVLLVVGPNFPMMNYEVDRVLDWVEKGNNLAYLDYCMYGAGQHLLSRLGLSVSNSGSFVDWEAKELPAISEMAHVSKLVLSSETRLSGGKPILKDANGALIVQVRHGKGRCLIATLPSLCSNRRIADKECWGNFQFLLNWLQSCKGKILFDEKVHGYNATQSFFIYIARSPAGLLCAQILLIFLVALFSLNQRFGPAKLITVKRKIASSEYIDGMALTYRKARAYDAAFSILYSSFRNRLCKALSLSGSDKIEDIAASWSHSTKLSAEETLSFLNNADRLQSERNATAEELLESIKECDRLYEESKPYLAVQPGRRLGG